MSIDRKAFSLAYGPVGRKSEFSFYPEMDDKWSVWVGADHPLATGTIYELTAWFELLVDDINDKMYNLSEKKE